MTRLTWGELDKRVFEAGLDRGVLYPKTGPGVPWDGLLSVVEDDSNSVQSVQYIDGQKIVTQLNLGTFAAELSALTYPLEFEKYAGVSEYGLTNQKRETFNFSYRTLLGSALADTNYGYKLHLVFNALAAPTSRNVVSLNQASDLTELSWQISTTPVHVEGARNSAHFVVDTRQVYPEALEALENMLYGTDTVDARFPTVSELLALFESYAIFKVVDNGDGTATISGPDDAVFMVDGTTAELNWPSVVDIGDETYRVSSL